MGGVREFKGGSFVCNCCCNIVPCAHQFCNKKTLLSNTSWIEIRKKDCVACLSLFDCIGWGNVG